MYSQRFTVLKQEEVIYGHRLMCLDAPEIAAAAAPGQFLHVRCADTYEPLLRRPISVHYADRERGRVYLLYRIAGRGTALLAKVRAGESVDVMGPLGKGYYLPGPGERVAVLGGGIGIAPLFFLLSEIKRIGGPDVSGHCVFLGAATFRALPAVSRVKALGFKVHTATDDGTGGYRGNVVRLAEEVLGGRFPERVYACGPLPMLKSLSSVLGSHPLAEVSVEEHMGCGVGACLSCVCRVKGDGGDHRYAHVCKDGPVFKLDDLCLE